jgi:hypothetical protein
MKPSTAGAKQRRQPINAHVSGSGIPLSRFALLF